MGKEKIYKVIAIIVLSSVLIFLTNNIIDQNKDTVVVYVTKESIPSRTVIEKDMLIELEVSYKDKENLFPNACEDIEDAIGKVSVRDIPRKHVMLYDDSFYTTSPRNEIVNNNGDILLGYFVPFGKKLMSFEVKAENSLFGRITKGDFIDIIFTADSKDLGGIYSSSLEKHVEVFDIENDGNKSIFFVLVSEKQAKNIALGKEQGVIDVILASNFEDKNEERPAVPFDLFKGNLPSNLMKEIEGN